MAKEFEVDRRELVLPESGWLCQMEPEYDFEEMPDLPPEAWLVDAVDPPYVLFDRDTLHSIGWGEPELLAHASVQKCCPVWSLYEPRFIPTASKRAFLGLGANIVILVYTDRDAALADAALNYPANQLLWELASSSPVRRARRARKVLDGDLAQLAQLARALREAGDDRATWVKRIFHSKVYGS